MSQPTLTYRLGDREVGRLGYGAMQLAGPGVFGPPKLRRVCPKASKFSFVNPIVLSVCERRGSAPVGRAARLRAIRPGTAAKPA